jgi:hypothetical protein
MRSPWSPLDARSVYPRNATTEVLTGTTVFGKADISTAYTPGV